MAEAWSPHFPAYLVGVAAQEAQIQSGVVDVVVNGVVEVTPAEQVAEHFVDDGPLDDRVGVVSATDLVEVVHPRALHPRADVGHVDEEVRFDDERGVAADRRSTASRPGTRALLGS